MINRGIFGWPTPATGTGALAFSRSPTFTGTVTVNGSIIDTSGGATFPSVIGGAGVGSSLTLQSTSGVGTTDFIDFLVGNAGGTRVARMLHSGFLGLNTSAPDARLTVQQNTALPATLPSGTTVHINGPDATLNALTLDGYAQQSYVAYRRANTSAGSPSALAAGNVIGGFQWLGYGATGYGASARIVINGVAAEGWSDTAQGAYISFFSTALTTLSVQENMRLQPSGGLSVGNSLAATDPGQGNLLLSGFINTGGDKRVATQFDKTSDTTLANITGLSVTLLAGQTYAFEAMLYTTSNVGGGVKAAIAGTATATAIVYEALVFNGAALSAQTRSAALAGAVGGVTAVTAALIRITGTITVNAAGTLTVQFAQNASNGAASSVLVGSILKVWQIT